MPWLTAALLAAGLVLVVLGAGLCVLVAAGARPRDAVSAAPAVGTGVVGLSAVAAAGLGASWGVLPVALGAAVSALVAALVARLRARFPLVARPAAAAPAVGPVRARERLVTAAAVLAGSLLALVPLAAAMGRTDRVHNAWDALFHLTGVDLLRRGVGTDLRGISELASPDGTITYPFAWHAVAALAPDGVDPVSAVNVAAFAPVVVLGVAGLVALSRALFPGTPYVGAAAAVLSAGAVGAPLAIAIQPGLIPNAYGLALVPGALAWVVRANRVTAAAVVPLLLAVAGIGLSHPGALLGLGLLASPWVAARIGRWVREPGVRSPAGQRRALVVALGALCAAIAFALVQLTSTGAAVAGTKGKPPVPAAEVGRRLLTGDLGEWPVQPLVVVVLAVVGATALALRRQVVLLVAALLAVAAYAGATSPWPVVYGLTALWYTETRRIAPLVGLTVTVMAAYGLVVVVGRVRDAARRRHRTATTGNLLAAACVVALMTAAVGTGARAVHGVALDAFTQDVPDDPTPMTRVPYLTADEERMVDRLADVLGPDDLVLGSSFTGASHLAVLTGARTGLPYHTIPLGEDAGLVNRRLADLGRDPAVCEAVRRHGATYVYVDPYPLHSTYWTQAYPSAFGSDPGPAARLVDRGGSASVHSLEVCYPDGPRR